MKRLILCKALLFMLVCGFAQTQVLPDMRISGETDVKTYLYKRSMLFSTLSSMGDSLPAFIPPGVPLSTSSPVARKMKHRIYVQLEACSEFGFNSFVSFYPNSQVLKGLTHRLELRTPASNWISFRNNLFVGTEPQSNLPLAFRINHTTSEAPGYKNLGLGIAVSYHQSLWETTFGDFENLSMKLGYLVADQTNATQSYKQNHLNYHFSTVYAKDWLNLKTKLLGQTGESGFQFAPSLNWEPYDISSLRVHLLADAYSFIPSLEFAYRNPLSNGGVLSLSNEPLLESNSFTSLLDSSPWVSFSNSHKLQKTPLNLVSGLEYIYPRSPNFSLTRLFLSNTLRYDVHAPVYGSSVNFGIPEVQFTDIVSNTCSVKGFFRQDNLGMQQSIGFNLGYLSKQSYRRMPYQPALKLDTRLIYLSGNWLFSTDLLQHYFQKDHQGNNLPESITLNMGAEYRINNSALYLHLANLLNHKQFIFSEQAPFKRNIFLGAKQRF